MIPRKGSGRTKPSDGRVEPELDDVEGNVFIKGVENGSSHAVVIGGAVDEKKPVEEAEVGDRVIRGAYSKFLGCARRQDPSQSGSFLNRALSSDNLKKMSRANMTKKRES